MHRIAKVLIGLVVAAVGLVLAVDIAVRVWPGKSFTVASYITAGSLPPIPHEMERSAPLDRAFCYQALVEAHLPAEGRKVIVTSVQFRDPRRFTWDDELTELVSIEIDEQALGHEIQLPSNDARVAYSKAGNFVGCYGFFGLSPQGVIRVSRNGPGELRVFIDAQVTLHDPRHSWPDRTVRIKENFVSKQGREALKYVEEIACAAQPEHFKGCGPGSDAQTGQAR
jgi:hypothetical protein